MDNLKKREVDSHPKRRKVCKEKYPMMLPFASLSMIRINWMSLFLGIGAHFLS